jgi:hypothetical protein
VQGGAILTTLGDAILTTAEDAILNTVGGDILTTVPPPALRTCRAGFQNANWGSNRNLSFSISVMGATAFEAHGSKARLKSKTLDSRCDTLRRVCWYHALPFWIFMYGFISQKVCKRSSWKSQFPHKSVNVSCAITNVKNNMTHGHGRAIWNTIGQSRPDSGLGLSHFELIVFKSIQSFLPRSPAGGRTVSAQHWNQFTPFHLHSNLSKSNHSETWKLQCSGYRVVIFSQ